MGNKRFSAPGGGILCEALQEKAQQAAETHLDNHLDCTGCSCSWPREGTLMQQTLKKLGAGLPAVILPPHLLPSPFSQFYLEPLPANAFRVLLYMIAR